MNEFLDQALNKLAETVSGQKENAMAPSVREALTDFCRQDAEFAQAVDASAEQIAAAVKEAEKAAKAKRDAAVAKKAEELKEAEAQRDEARKAVENAEAGKKAAEEQAAALRAELEKARKSAAAMDNKALAEFGVLFRQAQETVNRLTELAGELDEENRPKVYRALGALRNMIAEKAGEATA